MKNEKLYINNIKHFASIIDILESFFKHKKYNKSSYLNKLKTDIYTKTKITFTKKRLSYLLINYHNNYHYLEHVDSLKKKIIYESGQSGGFFFSQYDNKYYKALNIIDFLIDIINLIPNKIISKSYNNVTLPYAMVSFILNILRGDHDFAFYSFIGMIPGVGGILSASSKIIHRIIRNIIYQQKEQKAENYYKEIQTTRTIHEFLKKNDYDKLDNPFITKFEGEYDYKTNYYINDSDIK